LREERNTVRNEANVANEEAAESKASSEALIQNLTVEKETVLKDRNILLTIVRGEVRLFSNQEPTLNDIDIQVRKVPDLVKTAQKNAQHLAGESGKQQSQQMTGLIKAVADLSTELDDTSLDRKTCEPLGLESFTRLGMAHLKEAVQNRKNVMGALPQKNLGAFLNGAADLKQRHYMFEDLSNVSDLGG
jgi:hypothetical protein